MDREHQLAVLRETVPSVKVERVERDASQIPLAPADWRPESWGSFTSAMGMAFAVAGQMPQREALTLSTFLICTDVLQQDIAKVPMRMYEKVPGGKKLVDHKKHWMAALLALEPNRYHTWTEFWGMVVNNLCTHSNAYVAKRFENPSMPIAVEELLPIQGSSISQQVNADRSAFVYQRTSQTAADDVIFRGIPTTMQEDEIIHFRARLLDGVNGHSTLAAGAKVLRLSQELVDYQQRLYSNDAAPRGVFEVRETAGDDVKMISDEAFQRLRMQLAEAMTNFRRQMRPLILEDGLTFKAVQMTADEAEVSKAIVAQIEAVCRLFRMPPHKVMHLQAVKYENLESMEKSYVNDTLIPICRNIEERLAVAVLVRKERLKFFFEFDREIMVLSDIQKQTEANKLGLTHGAMLVDEYRASRGWNPFPNKQGQVRLLPSTYAVIDMDGEIVIPAGGGASENDAEAPDTDGSAGEDDAGDAKNKPKKGADVVSLRAV
jgi:HK97 family phage portal protein